MYFWNIHVLKQQLIERSLTERQMFYYILAISMVGQLLYAWMEPPSLSDGKIYCAIYVALTLGITAWGVSMAFKANDGDTGQHFSERFFAIGWVASIRFSVFSLPIWIIFIFAESLVEAAFSDTVPRAFPFRAVSDSGDWLLLILFYQYNAKHVHEVARGSSRYQRER